MPGIGPAPGRPRWRRAWRLALGAILAVSLAGVVALGWLLARFDGPRLQRELVEQVATRLDRRLEIDDGLRLSVLPSIAIEVSGLRLSGPGGEGAFASIARARIAVAPLPLLTGRLLVREVLLESPSIRVQRHADGRTDIDDLMRRLGPPAQGDRRDPARPGVEISRLRISGGRLDWLDARGGPALEVSSFDASARGLGGSAPAPVELKATVRSRDPQAQFELGGRLSLAIDDETGRWSIGGLSAEARGTVGAMASRVEATLAAASVAGGAGPLQGGPIRLRLRQFVDGRVRALDLSVPAFESRGERLGPVPIEASLGLTGEGDRLQAQFSLPLEAQLAGAGARIVHLRGEEWRGEVEGRLGGRTLRAALRAKGALDLRDGRFELPRLAVKASLGAAAGSSAEASTLALDVRGHREGGTGRLGFEGLGRLDEGALRVQVSRAAGDQPLTFEIEAERLDLDRHRRAAPEVPRKPGPERTAPPAPAPEGTAPPAPAPEGTAPSPQASTVGAPRPPEAPAPRRLDPGVRDGLAVRGSVRVARLRAAGVNLTAVRAEVSGDPGRLSVAPFVATVHGGRIEAAATASRDPRPRATVRLAVEGVRVGPLLAEAALPGLIDGRARMRADLTLEGADRASALRSLSGSASLHLSDGRVRGVDIAALLREAGRPLTPAGETPPRAPAGETGFADLSVSFAIRQGVAYSRDLAIRSPLLRVGGEGSVDLVAGRIDYLLRPTLVGTLAGQGGRPVLPGITLPVRVRGPLGTPAFTPEPSALLPDALARPIESLRERLPASPGTALKGLLGR